MLSNETVVYHMLHYTRRSIYSFIGTSRKRTEQLIIQLGAIEMAWESGKHHYKTNKAKTQRYRIIKVWTQIGKKRYKSRYLTSKPQISTPFQLSLAPFFPLFNNFSSLIGISPIILDNLFSPFLLFGRLYLLSFNQLSNWIPLPFHLLFSSLLSPI